MQDNRGLNKLVAYKITDKILGAHTLTPEVGGSIKIMLLVIETGLIPEDLANTIFPYHLTVDFGLHRRGISFGQD